MSNALSTSGASRLKRCANGTACPARIMASSPSQSCWIGATTGAASPPPGASDAPPGASAAASPGLTRKVEPHRSQQGSAQQPASMEGKTHHRAVPLTVKWLPRRVPMSRCRVKAAAPAGQLAPMPEIMPIHEHGSLGAPTCCGRGSPLRGGGRTSGGRGSFGPGAAHFTRPCKEYPFCRFRRRFSGWLMPSPAHAAPCAVFSIDGLIRTARRRARSEDFGDVDITEPLRRLLDACTTEARLSLVGRLATQWDVVRFLFQPAAAPGGGSSAPRNPGRADRAADLHHRPAAQRHDLPAPHDAGRPRQPRAPGYETIYPCAPAPGRRVGARHRWPASSAPSSALAPEFHGAASAGIDVAAGMLRDHRARVPQPSLRHHLSRSVLSAARFLPRCTSGLSLPSPLPPASGVHDRRSPRWVLKCPDHVSR